MNSFAYEYRKIFLLWAYSLGKFWMKKQFVCQTVLYFASIQGMIIEPTEVFHVEEQQITLLRGDLIFR